MADAIASVRRQTLLPDRIIVVDDGSSDASVALADSLGVECIRQPQNAGPSAAQIRSTDAASFRFIEP